MPKLVALNQIHVFRDKKRTVVQPGTLFDFTAEEVADLDKNCAATGFESYRTPVNEGGNEPVAKSGGNSGKSGGKSEPAADTEL